MLLVTSLAQFVVHVISGSVVLLTDVIHNGGDALLALVQVAERFLHPQTPTHLWALLVAGVVGVAGNEVAAVIRWRAGRCLESPALVADGNHAGADG